MRVLLAEDEPDLQLITRLALEDAGHSVTAVGDGVEALERLAQEPFDLALLDVMMPRLDGYGACAQMQRSPTLRAVPVIFLTARSQEQEVQRGAALGARGYIIKPFDIFTLAERIDALLASAEGYGRGSE